jgi:vesicle-fusing ATPase
MKGREQILQIHTRKMRENQKLAGDVNLSRLAELTKNFSGAEIEGLVKSAASFAMYGAVDATNKIDLKVSAEGILVKMDHFMRALTEVLPAFGVADDELKGMVRGTLINYSDDYKQLLQLGYTWLRQVKESAKTPLLTVLLEGEPGCGKSALAAQLGLDSAFPFIKVISPEAYIGYNESGKCNAIAKVFEDAYKSPLSLIILDNIERLLDYVHIGPRFSNQVLQTLLVLLKRIPSQEKRVTKLMVIATTSSITSLKDMEFQQTFNVVAHVPQLTHSEHVVHVFEARNLPIDDTELAVIAANTTFLPLGIKQMIMLIEMAQITGQKMTAQRFLQCVHDCALAKTHY